MCIVRRLRIGLGSFKSRFCRFHDERSSTRNTIRHASIPSTHRATRYIMSYSVRRSTTKRFYPVNAIERGGGDLLFRHPLCAYLRCSRLHAESYCPELCHNVSRMCVLTKSDNTIWITFCLPKGLYAHSRRTRYFHRP